MTKLTLEDCMKLSGVENLPLTPSQQKFLIESTQEMLERYGMEELSGMKGLLHDSLMMVLKET